MIISLTIVCSFARVKQEISSDKFKDHASQTPQISWGIIIDSKHNFGSSILSSLNSLSEMEMCPTAITKITDLTVNCFIDKWTTFMHLFVFLCLLSFFLLRLLSIHVFKWTSLGKNFDLTLLFLLLQEVVLNLLTEVSVKFVDPLTLSWFFVSLRFSLLIRVIIIQVKSCVINFFISKIR